MIPHPAHRLRAICAIVDDGDSAYRPPLSVAVSAIGTRFVESHGRSRGRLLEVVAWTTLLKPHLISTIGRVEMPGQVVLRVLIAMLAE